MFRGEKRELRIERKRGWRKEVKENREGGREEVRKEQDQKDSDKTGEREVGRKGKGGLLERER